MSPLAAVVLWVVPLTAGCAGALPRGGGALACPRDATLVRGACRCAPGLSVLEGACVGPRELDAYCAPLRSRETAGAGSCATVVCAPGEPLDLATGTCAPAERAREIAAEVRPIPEDLAIGCHDGRTLVVRGDAVACLSMADACPRGSEWDARAATCARVAACAAGEVRESKEDGDGSAGACVPVVARPAQGAPVVDIGRWSRAVLGPDGGEGTARLCRPFTQQLWEGDLGPGGARALAIRVLLRFPNNDVSQLSADVRVLDAASGQPALGDAGRTTEVARASLAALLGPLRALGGTADGTTAGVAVRCTVHGGGALMLFPR